MTPSDTRPDLKTVKYCPCLHTTWTQRDPACKPIPQCVGEDMDLERWWSDRKTRKNAAA